jgi:RNA polymerase sigma-70 factor, ECF subfamily
MTALWHDERPGSRASSAPAGWGELRRHSPCKNRLVAHADSSSASSEFDRASEVEEALLEGIRQGDERVFAELVQGWSSVMLRLALVHVDSRAVAEEVVQEAWLTVLRDVERFEGRSPLRTWVLGIVVNLARSRARAERRSVALPDDIGGSVADGARFRPRNAARWPDHWALAPVPWPLPEEALLASEARSVILDAIVALPSAQREVLVVRDLEGVSAAEACNVLGLSDTNQRVLLHRARSRVRNALERYFDATEPT